ncbi:MAG: hypothetical protein DDT31_00521 [Syntrophomonadaceae bacterium]|nr:hypothetical protein [Candidatus Psychracetigena formicireducens]MBT9137977.1 hypothetical protein [Bacillota bacterium]
MSTTRFPNGLTNVKSTSSLGSMGQLDPSRFNTFFNDFNTYAATDWIVTAVGTGTTALIGGDGGLLQVTTSAAAPDSRSAQLVVANFFWEAHRRMFFKAAGVLSHAVDSVFQLGLVMVTTTPPTATNGIYLLKPAGTANIGAFVRRDATTGNVSNTAIGVVNGAYSSYGFSYNADNVVTFFINDRAVASLPCNSLVNSPNVNLAVTFHIGNGSAVSRNFTLDYIFAAKER